MSLTCINEGCIKKRHYTGSKYRPYCGRCHEASYGKRSYASGVRPIKKEYCENIDGRLGYKCTSTINGSHQLDLDHKDGNDNNNIPENIQTLCKVCHSDKTKTEKESFSKKNRGLANCNIPPTFPDLFQYGLT